MLEQYSDQLKKKDMDGYAEKVPVEETYVQGDKVWYLPYHAVVSAAKPGKVRVVFDCAAKHGEVCLNNQRLQGPDMNNKQIHVALLASKARLALIKQVTNPRLELLAAVVASKLDVIIRTELDVPLLKSTLWTDSKIILVYIQSDSRRFKVFVANIVSLIREKHLPYTINARNVLYQN